MSKRKQSEYARNTAQHVYVLKLSYMESQVLKIGFSGNVFRRIRVFKNLGIKTEILHISIANGSQNISHLEKLLLEKTKEFKTTFPVDFSGKTEIRKIESASKINYLIYSYNQETLFSRLDEYE